MKGHTKMKKAILLMAGMLALSVLAESFELVNGSLATNEMKVVLDKAGDHLTLVGSTLTVTNEFVTIDRDAASSFNLRRGRLFIGITNSTLTSIDKRIEFTAYKASGNTTRVDVVNSTFNATNAAPGLLSLGVHKPNATWQERIFFHATNSTFNLSAFRGYGALNALFECCTLTFDDHIPSNSGFGPGSAASTDAADVVFRDCYITNWTLRFGDYAGAAPSRVTIDGGTAYFQNIVGYKQSPGHLVLTNGAAAWIKRTDAFEAGTDQWYWNYLSDNIAGTVEIVDGASFGLVTLNASKMPYFAIAQGGTGAKATWRLRNGTFDDSRNGRAMTVYLGYKGSADLYLEEGSLFKTYRAIVGGYTNTLVNPVRSTIYQTGGTFWACRISEENVESYIELANRDCCDARYYLNGGTLKTPRIFGGIGAAVNGGTRGGWAQLSADGGRLVPGANSVKYPIVSKLDLAECGPKGLTVDTEGYSSGAIIEQDFTNKEGEQGLFRKTGANTLMLRLPGRYDWDVSTTCVDGGTLLVSNATAVLKTTLVVTNGATLSMVGDAADLTLDALVVANGVIALDPGDKIVVPGNALSLGDVAIEFSSALAGDTDADIFVCEGAVSSANLRRIRAALASAVVPEGKFCTVVAEESDGVTHLRLKVAESGPVPVATTVWHGAADAWGTAANWSEGVPTAATWSEFSDPSATRTLTVPAASVAGSLRFAEDGYTLAGGILRIPGLRGGPVIANEVGTNTISAAMAFDDIVEITNAPNTKLVLSGEISAGGFKKTGEGRLELASANMLDGRVTLAGGWTAVKDADAFGTYDGMVTPVMLTDGILDFDKSLGDGASVAGDFSINASANTRAVAFFAKTNVTIGAVDSTCGAFIKAGPGRLTMQVKGGEKLVARSVHAKTPYPTQYFPIVEDGTLPDNAEKSSENHTYFTGVNIYEGELAIRSAAGVASPTVTVTEASTVIGMHTDCANVTPELTIDGVVYNGGTSAFYANGYNMNNKMHYDYEFVPSLFRCRLNIVDGGVLRCGTLYATQYGGSNKDMKPVITMTNGTISASTRIYIAHSGIGYASHNTNALATLNAKASTMRSPEYVVDGHVASDFDGSTLRAANASSYATLKGGQGAYGKMRFHDGSVFRVGTLDFLSEFKNASPTRVFTLAFDDAEWQYGSGSYTLASSVVDASHATNFVISMEGKGVVLKPASGTTFTTQLPFQGDGGMVVDGPGTVAFAADTVKFAGVAEVKQGTLDLSAAGTLDGFAVKGPGVVHGATLVNPTIALDVDGEWNVSGVPVFDGCTLSGAVKVDCGHDAATALPASCDTPVVVARFTGAAPDVSSWRVKGVGTSGARGTFAVQGDTVVMTVFKSGFNLIFR